MSENILMDSPDLFEDIEDIEECMEIDPFSNDKESAPDRKFDVQRNNECSSQSWRGAPITEIIGADSPFDVSEFPKIIPAYNHTVLFHISKSRPNDSTSNCPSPQKGKDIWSREYVRMPCSPQSFYPVEEDGHSVLKNRWDLITASLSKPINDSYELEDAILEYNSKYRTSWKFTSLHKLFNEYLEEEETEHFFKYTLRSMVNLALELPQILPNAIPLLRQHRNKSISLSQKQVASLLANAFFCTFPRRNSRNPKSEYCTYPDINFNGLFRCSESKSVIEKLKCICHYFRRVCSKEPCGVVTFMRNSVENSKCPNWSKLNMKVGSIPLHINSNGTIENEGIGLLQVDFANKYLGGGVLGYGCVQEEIRFVICPELMVSMLFTEVLKPDEALLMLGCERYSDYTGYADSFLWSGNHDDSSCRDSSGRIKCAIIAIDALSFNNPNFQYKPEYIMRELKKAWVGFSVCSDDNAAGFLYPGVATGNWGCGAFRGSPYLKSLIQLMSCCVARRPMAYYTFGDIQLRDDIINMYNFLSTNNITIADLYKYLSEFHKSSAAGSQLYSYILQCHKDSQKTEQKFSFSSFSTKGFYAEKPNSSKTISLELKGEILNHTQNKLQNDESELKKYETKTFLETSNICDQQSTSRSFFDTVSQYAESNSSTKRESPAKKKVVLSFLEKNSIKTSKTNLEHKYDKSEDDIQNDLKDNGSKSDSKLEGDIPPKKTGKISDYFQRLQKH